MESTVKVATTEYDGDTLPHIIAALGRRTADYYRLLCAQDLDPAFAQLLTRDWHTAQLGKWMNANYVDAFRRPMTDAERERRESWRSTHGEPLPFGQS